LTPGAAFVNKLPTQDYFQNGYMLYPGLLGHSQVDQLRHEIERICGDNTLETHDKTRLEMEPHQPPSGRLVRRIYQPCTYYPLFREFSESAKVLDLVESIVGPDIMFHYSKINMKPPAIGSVVEWHQDLAYYPLTNDSSVTLLLYLDDADVGNGCLQVIPGKHHANLRRHNRDGYFMGKIVEPVDESNAILLEGQAGTAIFMDALTPHASVTNTSTRPRRTLILSYRAADAFPIYYGDTTADIECCARLVRGRPAESARFTFERFPIPRQKQKTASLYELQELSRQ
jgi:phytanoyl-CoA dioxygenase PhyH